MRTVNSSKSKWALIVAFVWLCGTRVLAFAQESGEIKSCLAILPAFDLASVRVIAQVPSCTKK
jgi:hypothetical protein